MTLAEYIKQLKEQGISREEAIPLIKAFKEKNGLVLGQDTTDENFQQDGVAGAGAPSVSVAPQDTELPQVDTSLELQDQQIDPVETVKEEPERFSKEKFFVYTDPQGVERQMSEEYYLNNLAGRSTTRGKYPVDFNKYRVSLGQREGYKVSELKISQPEPLEEVVVIGEASDSVKDSKKIAKKLRNKNLAINEDSEKNNIAVEYFLMDKLNSRDAGTTTYAGQYGTSRFVPTYKNDEEYDAYLKSELGDEKFNKLLLARSKAAKDNVELNKENIGNYISMDSIDEATKTLVINKKKDEENQIFLRNFDEKKQDEIRRFTGDEETVAKKNKLFNEAARFKFESQEKAKQAEKEYFELTGNILVKKTTHNGKVYDPTVRVLNMDKANANILKEREEELLALQKDFKEDVTVFKEKYENLIEAQSKVINYSAPDEVFNTDEEKAKRNSLLSNYETLWNQVTTEQSRLNQLQKELFKDINSFQDTKRIDAAILKNYEYGHKLAHVMEEAFLGSTEMLGSSIAKGIGDIGVATGIIDKENSWYQSRVEGKQHAIDYNRQLQEYRTIYLPDRLTAADSSSKGAYLADMLIENSPSILVAAATMGYGNIAAAGGGLAARIAATRAATNVATAIFFTMEAGGQMSNLEIAQQDAKKLLDVNVPGNLISQLKELKQKEFRGEIGNFEIRNIEQQIEDQRNLANLTQFQKSFNSVAYGGIASAAERFGSLSFINNFQKYAKAVGGNRFRKVFGDALGTKVSKQVGLATGVGIGASIELAEESLTLYFQNFSDNLVFQPKQPKSLIEGLDGEFFRNTVITSLGISGPSVSSNVYTSIKNEFTTRAQAKKESAIRQELIDIQKQINNTDLRTKQGRKLQKRKNDLLVEAAELNTNIILSGRNLSVSDINIIFDNAAEIQRLRNEALDLDPSSFNRKEFKRLKNKAQELMDQNQVILEKNDKAMAALASRASNPVEAETNFRRKQYFKAIAEANRGTNVIDINNVSELESYLEGLGLDDETQRAAILVYMNGGNAMNNNNDILLFNENIDQNIANGGIEAEIASVAALHELGHIQTRKAGIIKDDQLIADSANELVQSIINDVQARAEQGKITQEELDNFNNRISLYANKKYTATEGVDADELIQLVSDFTAIGILPKSSFASLYGAKTFINSLLKKFNGDAAALFGIKSPGDVYNFVSQFQNKAVKLQLPSGEEEGIKAQKALKEPSDQLNDIIKDVPKSKTNAEFKLNEAVDLYMNVISTEAPVETKNLLDKVIEKQLIKHDVNTRKDSENANPNVYGVSLKEFIDDVKLHLYDKTINRFDPAVNDNPGAFIITELVNFRVGEISNRYKARVQTKSIDVQAGETGSVAELVSEDVNIEDQIDAAIKQQTEAPRSALKQELQKDGEPFVDSDLQDAIETSAIKITANVKPDFNSSDLIPFLKTRAKEESFKIVKDRIGDTMDFLKDNDNYKTLFHSKNLPVSVLVAMERNVPVADRIFTGEPTRLTTQDQINKAVNEGDFYVENEKTGPSIYPRKKPTLEQLDKFFNVPAMKPSKKDPSKMVRSGLKGTRKDAITSAINFALFRDILPDTMRKLDKPQAEIAKTAEKLIVDPNIKFSLSDPAIKKFDKFDMADTVSRRLFKDSNNQGIDYVKLDEDQKAVVRQEMIDKNLANLNDLIIKFSKSLNDKIKTIDNKVFSKNISFENYSNKLKNEMLKDEEMLSLTKRDFNGKAYELYTANKINSLNIPDLKASSDWISDVDLVITFKGEKAPTEVKMDYTALLGSANLGYDLQTEKLQNSKTNPVSETIFKAMENSFIQHEVRIKEIIKQAEEISGEKITSMPFKLNKEDVAKLDKTGISTQVPMSIEAVFDHYNKKGVNYIIIDGDMFHLKENPLNLNVNQLDFNIVYKARIRTSGSGKVFRNINYSVAYLGDRKKSNKPSNGTKLKSIKFSKAINLNNEFNKIIERSTGISATATISDAKAALRGAKKGRFDFFISPSAEDFVGLLYKTLGKGEQGNADLKFYNDHLLKPFAKANNAITRERLALMDDYKAIKKQIGVVPKDLRKKLQGEDFTREQAVRVYVWTKQGMSVPGLSETDLKKLLTSLKNSPELITFGNQLININKGDGYAAPQNNWLSGSITTDLLQGLNTTKRAKHLQQWQDNVDVIFSKDNLNKLEAAYGKQYVEALKNMLLRMKTGRNRTYGTDSLTGKVTDWINGSVGAIMFFNTRSAVLQLMSATNFINFSDNNIFTAGKAFANQKQYWKDFIQLFNSDFLLARRDGLRMNVNEADIAEMAKKGGVRGVINELLRFGFTPTQLADSFAIAAGGSTFYRNRIKPYEKQTDVDGNKIYTKQQAEQKAFEDFRETAEESQQSSRPDKLSQQQTGSLGRLVLAFANTPSQYARIIKKAALDLKNGRGDAKTNISKIVYYTFAQNLLFNALQQGLFAMAFGDDDDDEKQKQKNIDVANGMANSLLRGMGFYGAAVAAVKDAGLRIYKESQKDRPKYEKAAIDFLNISPPISSKYRKIASAGRIIQYENGQIMQKGISIDNPAVVAGSRVVSAATNIPLDRLVTKVENINGALNQDVEYWQSIAMLLGWQDWQIGVEDEKDKKEKNKAIGIKRREVKRREVKRR